MWHKQGRVAVSLVHLSKNSKFCFFNGINDSSKRFVLRWLKLAKTEKTRIKRINQLAELSAKGEKLPGS